MRMRENAWECVGMRGNAWECVGMRGNASAWWVCVWHCVYLQLAAASKDARTVVTIAS